MSAKADYTAAEWSLLLRTPLLAGIALVTASPSGPIGVFHELTTMGRQLLAAGDAATPGSLLGDLVADARALAERRMPPPPEERIPPAELRDRMLGTCRETLSVLAAKATPDEAAAYKQWIVDVTTQVAQAAKEGTILGFGGTPVSPAERTLLREIADTLGVAAPVV